MPRPTIDQAGMRRYAEQTSQFEEGAVLRFLPATYVAGCCIALASDWLANRMRHGGYGRSGSRTNARFRSGPVDNDRSHWAGLMATVMPAQTTYRESGNHLALYARNGMREIQSDNGFSPSVRRTVHNLPDVVPITTILSAMACLRKGRGAILRFRVGTVGHAVGLYKSHGDNIHFFDSDCGAWRLQDPSGFLTSWLIFWHLENMPVSLEQDCVDFLELAS